MAVGEQKFLVTFHYKNNLRGCAADFINSINPSTWGEMKILFKTHFGLTKETSRH